MLPERNNTMAIPVITGTMIACFLNSLSITDLLIL